MRYAFRPPRGFSGDDYVLNLKVDEEHCFGRGSVDVNGLCAKNEAATGYPEWIMTKVSLSLTASITNLPARIDGVTRLQPGWGEVGGFHMLTT